MSNATETKNIGVFDTSAVDLDRAKIRHKTTYEWTEPKEGFIATLFPSEETWHPLYDNNIVEYATVLYSIDNNIDIQISENPKEKNNLDKLRDEQKDKVKKVIKQSFIVKAESRFIKSIIAVVIIIIIVSVFYYYNKNFMSGKVFIGIITLCILIPVAFAADAYINAPGRGTNTIHDYERIIASHSGTGNLDNKILQNIKDEYNKEQDRNVFSAARSVSQPSNLGLLGLMGLFR